jgi:hypothetical protein
MTDPQEFVIRHSGLVIKLCYLRKAVRTRLVASDLLRT